MSYRSPYLHLSSVNMCICDGELSSEISCDKYCHIHSFVKYYQQICTVQSHMHVSRSLRRVATALLL
jgi:hypothetical protein